MMRIGANWDCAAFVCIFLGDLKTNAITVIQTENTNVDIKFC